MVLKPKHGDVATDGHGWRHWNWRDTDGVSGEKKDADSAQRH